MHTTITDTEKQEDEIHKTTVGYTKHKTREPKLEKISQELKG